MAAGGPDDPARRLTSGGSARLKGQSVSYDVWLGAQDRPAKIVLDAAAFGSLGDPGSGPGLDRGAAGGAHAMTLTYSRWGTPFTVSPPPKAQTVTVAERLGDLGMGDDPSASGGATAPGGDASSGGSGTAPGVSRPAAPAPAGSPSSRNTPERVSRMAEAVQRPASCRAGSAASTSTIRPPAASFAVTSASVTVPRPEA